jgi:hypothetical protein
MPQAHVQTANRTAHRPELRHRNLRTTHALFYAPNTRYSPTPKKISPNATPRQSVSENASLSLLASRTHASPASVSDCPWLENRVISAPQLQVPATRGIVRCNVKDCLASWLQSANTGANAFRSKVIGGRIYVARNFISCTKCVHQPASAGANESLIISRADLIQADNREEFLTNARPNPVRCASDDTLKSM